MRSELSVTGIAGLHIQFLTGGSDPGIPYFFFPVFLGYLMDRHGNAGQVTAQGGGDIFCDFFGTFLLYFFEIIDASAVRKMVSDGKVL